MPTPVTSLTVTLHSFCLITSYKLWTLELIFSAKDPIVEKSCRLK